MKNPTHNFKILFVLLLLPVLFNGLYAQEDLPLVFPVGDHLQEVETLYQDHAYSLMEVCDYRIDSAGMQWMHMLQAMEDYSELIDFDLKGVRLILTVFYEADGGIMHLGFSRQATSRNVREELLRAFLLQFAKNYTLPLPEEAEKPFFHEGRANFPLRPIRKGEGN